MTGEPISHIPVSISFQAETISSRPIPEQWEYKAHPEGQPYYRSYRGNILNVTEADVTDSEVFGGIELVIRVLQRRLSADGFEEDAEVLLELSDKNEWPTT